MAEATESEPKGTGAGEMTNKLNIVYKNIEDLKPYEKNPRNNDNAVEYVANSIKEFGFKVPIIVDKNNVIVAGHTRYKACQKLGIKEVPCIIADDLTDKQIKAFRLADNKVSELATWNEELLLPELTELQNDFKFEDFGFTQTENVDINEFFNNNEPNKNEENKKIQCPYCKQWFNK